MTDHEMIDPPKSAWPARAAIAGALLLTFIAIAAIGWRWYHVRFPNAALFVRGTEASVNAEVIIANEEGYEIFRGRLTPQTSYQVVALVEQGIYGITVRRDGVTLVNDRLYVPNGPGVLVNVVREDRQNAAAVTPPQRPGLLQTSPATSNNP